MKYSLSDYYDGECTAKQYYDQFDKPKTLVVGETYVQSGSIYPMYFKILWTDEEVAVGVVVKDGNGGTNIGEREMFYNKGYIIGWRYKDNRSSYRLKEIK